MPTEVFDIWLAPLIELDGWPFHSEHTPATGVWRSYFDGHTIRSIKQLEWRRQTLAKTTHIFSGESKRVIKWLIDSHVRGIRTPVSGIKNGKGKESFIRSRDYIAQTGKLHTPAILIKKSLSYKIMDGNHRIAALFSVNTPILNFDAWVGE